MFWSQMSLLSAQRIAERERKAGYNFGGNSFNLFSLGEKRRRISGAQREVEGAMLCWTRAEFRSQDTNCVVTHQAIENGHNTSWGAAEDKFIFWVG